MDGRFDHLGQSTSLILQDTTLFPQITAAITNWILFFSQPSTEPILYQFGPCSFDLHRFSLHSESSSVFVSKPRCICFRYTPRNDYRPFRSPQNHLISIQMDLQAQNKQYSAPKRIIEQKLDNARSAVQQGDTREENSSFKRQKGYKAGLTPLGHHRDGQSSSTLTVANEMDASHTGTKASLRKDAQMTANTKHEKGMVRDNGMSAPARAATPFKEVMYCDFGSDFEGDFNPSPSSQPLDDDGDTDFPMYT